MGQGILTSALSNLLAGHLIPSQILTRQDFFLDLPGFGKHLPCSFSAGLIPGLSFMLLATSWPHSLKEAVITNI